MTAPNVTVTIVGAEAIQLRLASLAGGARAVVKKYVTRSGVIVQNNVKLRFLSGQALNKRSGRLINSINLRVTEDGDTITASDGTALPYGRFWELGYTGVEYVREYVRHVASRDVKGARYTRSGKATYSRKVTIAQGIGVVMAHSRRVNLAARPFLAPGLQVSRPAIQQEFEAMKAELAKLATP